MTGMEILASYGVYRSPKTLRAGASSGSLAADLVVHCCQVAATSTGPLNVEKVLDDMLQLQEHAFPMALSTDATHALVMKTLLSAATDASPQLRQLCPDPLLLVDAAKAHFKNAASSTSPEVSLALTYFAWAASDSTNDGIDDYSDYTAILDATQWLEQCQGHPIPPASILLRSPTDRLAFVQELLLQRPHECLQHVAQLSKVAKWLDLTEHELQLWIWAAYAHLQTGHVAEAIQLTISMLGKLNHRHDKDAYVAQVTSLALDLAALSGGHYEARRDLCRAALVVVSDASSFLALLESAKQLDAVVQAMTVLQLTDADVALEKSDVKIPIADWLYDQLTVHQEVVHMQPRLLQKSLKATMQLLLAFSTSLDHSSHIVDALCKDGADQRDQNLIAARPFPRVVGQLAASLLQTGDVDMAVSHLETLPVSQAYEIWVAACAGLEADPTAQTELAQVAHDFFTFGNHVDLAGHFASLQVSSKQAADLDALEALHPSVDRSRFEVDVVYRYAALVTVLHEDDSHRSMVFALCDQYRMHRWELCVEFLESLLVDADRVATRDVELKKAQLPVDENGQTLLELTLSQPDALSQRLLHSTWNRVNPYDSIAWEYLWRLCLACQKRSPHLDESIPVDRLKLFVACAKKLRESGVSIDLAHFCGPVTSPPDVALAVQAAIPVVSGSSIKMLAMLLSKLHGVPASALIMIYIDMLWTHETCPEKAYDAARPFLAGLTTDHVVMLVQHFVGLPVVASLPLEPLYGYTFQSRRSFPLRLTPPKRQVIVCDLYNLVRGRPGTGRSEGVAVLETHVLWSTLLAFVDAANVPLSSTLVMSAMAPAKDASTPPFDQVIADTCSRGLSLRQVRTLLQLTSALDHDRDHLPLFQRHVADFLSAHVPTLHDVDHASTPNKVYEYLVMKWTSTAEPCAVSLPSPMKLRDLEPLETLFCSTVLSWLDGVELSSTTVLLLKWLHDIVPTTVCDAWNLPSASIVAMLYDLHGAINWKQHQSQVTTDFPAVFALALEAVADSPYTNEGLARLLIQWESTHVSSRAPASTSWPMQLRRALIETIELDEDVVPSAAPETTLAGGRDLWDSLWKRRHWCEPALDALLRNTPSAYASLTEAAAFRFLTTFGFTAVALLSPFERVHKAALRQLDWANLTGSHVELVLVRFSLQELQMWPQVPWERFVLHCHRVDRLAAQRSASDALVHHALTSALHLVVGFVVEEDFAMASRILCQAGHIHPMLWNTNLYEPLLRQFLAGWKRPKTLDGPRQALVDKLAYLIE
ncbi:hypothetical protein DYB32_003939 [Aphanomyces invadans]|uniref:Uncharacterized protein n=1 Tax=Aphanomyces invadans TaxID=157072 RepID=A0A418AZ10_9STRA|nr:hypothetical protein DYB32_003939 [Aphanomyces invadans]